MPRARIRVLAASAIICAFGAAALAADPPAAAPPDPAHATPAAAAPAGAGRTPAPVGSYAYIGWPNNGEVIHSTKFHVWFGLRSMGVAPAGTTVPNTGHHHLLIDVALPPADDPIPNDKNHRHFGLGQTETTLELPAGTHTLQLLLGDADHISFNPPVMSPKITIYVKP